jgi:hypothetical protein
MREGSRGTSGRGTVLYEGIQDTNEPERMVWSISMYGELVLSGDRKNDGEADTVTRWWVLTGPPELEAMIAKRVLHPFVSW